MCGGGEGEEEGVEEDESAPVTVRAEVPAREEN